MGLTTKEISSSSFNDMISSVDRRSEYVENRAGANVRLNNFLTPYTLDDKSSILNAPCGYSNGVYPSLRPVQTFGPELIDLTQGTAEQPSQWSNITTNSVNFLPGAAGVRYFNVSSTNGTLISGKKYSLTLEISNYSGSGTLGISTQGGVSVNARLDTNATHSEVFTSDGGLIRIFGRATNSATITVSIKEEIDADFDFTRGSAATRVTKNGLIKNVQILSGELVQNGDFEQIGSELVTNGDFDTDSDWTKGSGWSISNGKAVSNNSTSSIYQSTGSNYTSGKTYKIVFTVSDYVSGSVRPEITNVIGSNVSSNGTFTQYIVATSSAIGEELKAVNFIGSIDNVSVKEVGQNWDIGSDWQILDGKLKYNSSAASSISLQDFNFTSGKKYKIEFEISDFTTDYRFDLYTGVSFIQSAIITSQTSFSYIFEGDGGIYLRFRGLQRGTGFSVDNVSIIEITDDTNLPRIDYTDGTGSLLLEPQSTNIQLRSQEFDNPVWTAQRATLTANDAISPDGTLNAYKLTHTTNTSGYVFDTIPIVNSGDSRLISVFAKYIDDEVFKIVTFTDSGNAEFNLLNGTVTSVFGTITDAKIQNYGNGWYRCSCKYTATITAARNYGFYLDDASKEGVHIWGAQVEQQSYATSYIPTSGSAVTRNAEVCNNAGSSNLINSTEGVLYAEIAALADDLTNRVISLSDGTSNERVVLQFHNTTNRIRCFIKSGGSFYATLDKVVSDITDFHKIAYKYKSGETKLFVDGSLITSSSNTFSITGLNVLQFANGTPTASPFYGNVRSVAVFKEALTDEELAKITSTTQQEVFYEMRDKMLQINADYYEFGDYTTRLKKLF